MSRFNNCLQSAASSLAPGEGQLAVIPLNSRESKDGPEGEATARGDKWACVAQITLFISSVLLGRYLDIWV